MELRDGHPHQYDQGGFLHRTHRHYAIDATGQPELVYSLEEVAREFRIDLSEEEESD